MYINGFVCILCLVGCLAFGFGLFCLACLDIAHFCYDWARSSHVMLSTQVAAPAPWEMEGPAAYPQSQ